MMRSINKRGRLVAERLAYGHAVLGEAPETAEWFEDGREIVGELRAAMHGDVDPRELEEGRVRHWQVYGRAIEQGALASGQVGIKSWLRDHPDAVRSVVSIESQA